ncbi:MAG: hypothetical protein RL122_2495 [Pseudomonadota bacterium]|jgi:hypothetical protein
MRHWLKVTIAWVFGIILALGIASLGQFLIYLCPDDQLQQLATTGYEGTEMFTLEVTTCQANWYNTFDLSWMVCCVLIYLLLPTSLALRVTPRKKTTVALITMLATLLLLSMAILLS